ncbi:MAG TPA: phytoene/squalene synthase family protein, partial [Polyangiaceae bacterium]|nr:phytoene/squalene synthase family protein [Polyangiaceae bacterium]
MSGPSARAVLAAHSKSFALSAKLLPRSVREDVAVLYAYCRHVDDAVDEAPAHERFERVWRLERELASIAAGEIQTEPLLEAFRGVLARRAIPIRYPRALLDGVASDLGPVRIRTLDELLRYAYRVAGVVGLMVCHVTGVSDERALPHAVHLGIAMQLTNICRDVAEDWERRRLYLPAPLLAAAGAAELGESFSEPLANHRASLARAVSELLRLAERYYASGDAGIRALPLRAALAVRAARNVYAAIGRELERRHFDVLAGRAFVPTWKKLLLVLCAVAYEVMSRAARALGF